jgi:adenylate cyclase
VFSLHLFCGLSLHGPDGPVVGRVAQRRRLALLAVLAVERRPVSRDKLLAFFWPDADSERGRRLLADSLYVLRSGLGDEGLVTQGDDVALNDGRIESDVGRFMQAVEAGQLETAVGIYAGAFLDGVFISEAPEFERWAEGVRSRLAAEHRGLLEALACEADERHDYTRAVGWWRQLAAADRVSARAALGLMRALMRAGDRAAALQYARVHEEIVRGELDAPPDPAVTSLAEQIRTSPDAVLNVRGDRQERLEPPVRPALSSGVVAVAAPTVITAEALVERAPSRRRRRRIGVASALSVLIVAVATWATFRSRAQGKQPPTTTAAALSSSGAADPTQQWIAVLPFDPISSNPEAEYIADGITEALNVALGGFQRLHVISPTSARAAKRTGLSAIAIGDTLRSRYLVTGSVRLAGRKLRVSAALADARDGVVLWSESFDGDFTAEQVIGLEEKVARSIAAALNLRLASVTSPSLVPRQSANTEAFKAYLLGVHFWNSRNPDAVRKSLGYFEQAIAKDSTFAAAFAGQSDAYATIAIGNIGDFRPDEYFPRAAKAAEKALSLDSSMAEAHASYGYVALLYDLDWAKAARELDLALELRPSYSTARIYRSILFEWTGRFDDAVLEAQSALDLDPITLASNIELGRALFFARRYEQAAARFRMTLDLDSTSLRAHMHLGQVYVQQHRWDDGIRELREAVVLSENSSRPLALLSHAYAAAGRRAEAAALLDSLRQRARLRYVPAFDFAIAHAGLGHMTEAFQSLDSAVKDHSIRPYLMDPTFDTLKQDRRYPKLLAQLRLPPHP